MLGKRYLNTELFEFDKDILTKSSNFYCRGGGQRAADVGDNSQLCGIARPIFWQCL